MATTYTDYAQDLPLFVRRMTFYLAARMAANLDALHRGTADPVAQQRAELLLSGLQVLSYLREADNAPDEVAEIVNHLLTLVDLQDTGLEPYNLYYRATRPVSSGTVLADSSLPVGAGPLALLAVAPGLITRVLVLPQVYPAPAPLTYASSR